MERGDTLNNDVSNDRMQRNMDINDLMHTNDI